MNSNINGIVQVNDKGFSTNDVFIYDDNNKFLTTPDEKGYYEFFTEKKKMNIVFLLVGSLWKNMLYRQENIDL